jgi:methylthioribulose-1-phosphate dehydratase
MAAFKKREARCCIHSHSVHAVLVTLILDKLPVENKNVFEINHIEQIKAFDKGFARDGKRIPGTLGYRDTLRIPVIENTDQEKDLTSFLEEAMDSMPEASAVLGKRASLCV